MCYYISFVLRPHAWLDCEVIDAAIKSLFQRCYNIISLTSHNCCYKGAWISGYWNGHYIVHKTMINCDYTRSHSDRNDSIDLTALPVYDILCLPYHQPGHWILFVCHIKTRKIILYDSSWQDSIGRNFCSAIFKLFVWLEQRRVGNN